MSGSRARPLLPATVGMKPHRVWVGARPEKGGVVYLRWRRGNNWGWRSLRFTLDGKPAAERAALEARAYEAAMDLYQQLSGKRAPATQRRKKPLTLADAWPLLTDPKAGRYPADTPYRRELRKALADAARIWGRDFPFASVDRGRIRELTRAHADRVMRRGGVGFRAAEVLATRILTITRQLMDEGHVPEDLALPNGRAWREELKSYCIAKRGDALPAPARPRYTLDEFRRLLTAAPAVDPRFGLMTALGAELRAGQVARARRSHLALKAGTFTVHGRGKKGGTTIDLTPGQLAAVAAAMGADGYLRDVEAAWRAHETDYLLFPSALRGGRAIVAGVDGATVSKQQVRKWLDRAEAAAGIVHVRGRSWYGGRRVAVDEALDENVREEVLENVGGWSDVRTPQAIYRERGRSKARADARDLRARIRGEAPATEEGKDG